MPVKDFFVTFDQDKMPKDKYLYSRGMIVAPEEKIDAEYEISIEEHTVAILDKLREFIRVEEITSDGT